MESAHREREPGEKMKVDRSSRPHNYNAKLAPALLTFNAVDCFIYYKNICIFFKLHKMCCVRLSVQRGREEDGKKGTERERAKEECG